MSVEDFRPSPDPEAAKAAPSGWSLVALLAVLAASTAISVRDNSSPRPGAAADETSKLVGEKAEVARGALRQVEKAWEIGAPVNLPTQEYFAWSRRLLEAQIFLSLGPDEAKTEDVEVYLNRAKGAANPDRVSAFEAHLRRMRQLEERYRPMYERKQFSAFDFATLEYRRLQAQVWLTRENARRGD